MKTPEAPFAVRVCYCPSSSTKPKLLRKSIQRLRATFTRVFQPLGRAKLFRKLTPNKPEQIAASKNCQGAIRPGTCSSNVPRPLRRVPEHGPAHGARQVQQDRCYCLVHPIFWHSCICRCMVLFFVQAAEPNQGHMQQLDQGRFAKLSAHAARYSGITL